MPFQEPVNCAEIVSVTSRRPFSWTLISAANFLMTSWRAFAGSAAAKNRKTETGRASQRKNRADSPRAPQIRLGLRGIGRAEADLGGFAFGSHGNLEKFAG